MNLRVIDDDLGLLVHEMFADVDAGGLACVTCVLLEGKPKDGDSLPSDCLEQLVHYQLGKSAALEVIHSYHLWGRGWGGGGGEKFNQCNCLYSNKLKKMWQYVSI